jgi:methionyl-tRNA synthetase
MTNRYRGDEMPPWSDAAATDWQRLTQGVVGDYVEAMEVLSFDVGLQAMWRAVQAGNRYVEEQKPWVLAKAGDERADDLDKCLRVLLEVLRSCSVLCLPFMPEKTMEMRKQLGLEDDNTALSIEEASQPGDRDWKKVGKPTPLFPRLEVPEED